MQIVELETELRPCPFCGAEAIAKTDRMPSCSGMNEHYWVKCSNADCAVSPKSHPNLDAAITRWNIRMQCVNVAHDLFCDCSLPRSADA
jgi:hypothetical protein